MNFGGIFDVDNKAERLVEVNQTLEDPKIWDDPKQAQALGKEKKLLDGVVGTINFLTDNITASQELLEMAKEEGDFDTIRSIESDTANMRKQVED
ncbi:MAG: PCRF domain-containing protein, partial [Polynucleobacter victoriensis]